jgi:CoA:oxalate CoA-transferase
MAAPGDAPLKDVMVLDFTQFLAGPYATQILGDLGARVIRIEPIEPELARTLPPNFYKGDSAYYLSVNRNKESLAIDLRTEAGKAAVRNMVGQADILVENFRPGVAARLGLGYETLKLLNPRLVMCSISGFGQDGPYRNRPAYDIIVQAMSGGMSITGPRGGESVRAGLPLGDECAGLYGTIGILAALTKARETGEGSLIDIAMLDCQVALLSYQAAYHLMSGEVPGPQGKSHDSIPTYRAFRCVDDVEIVIAANTEGMWRNLCAVLGLDTLADDERFKTNGHRLRNRLALDPVLETAFARRSSADMMDALLAHNVPAGVINTLDRVMADPQVLHRGMVLTLVDDDGSKVRVAGNPIKNGSTAPRRFPPALGEQSRQLLAEFAGLGEAEIDALESAGIIASHSRKARSGISEAL